jgi:hypothetical protein
VGAEKSEIESTPALAADHMVFVTWRSPGYMRGGTKGGRAELWRDFSRKKRQIARIVGQAISLSGGRFRHNLTASAAHYPKKNTQVVRKIPSSRYWSRAEAPISGLTSFRVP